MYSSFFGSRRVRCGLPSALGWTVGARFTASVVAFERSFLRFALVRSLLGAFLVGAVAHLVELARSLNAEGLGQLHRWADRFLRRTVFRRNHDQRLVLMLKRELQLFCPDLDV